MLIKTLVENTAVSSEFGSVHGLSFYIEVGEHKLLFDLGPNALFLENAQKLGVDISAVDTVIISHGHNDHGGALGLFLKRNNSAKVYVHERAFEGHYTKVLLKAINIGLEDYRGHPQVVLTGDSLDIGEGLTLFSGISANEYMPKGNSSLLMRDASGKLLPDDFAHEQNLIISSGGKRILVAGCSHRGIVNICRRAEEIIGGRLDCVIAGFHLFSPVTRKCADKALAAEIAEVLAATDTRYFTCHCTGLDSYEIMKAVMGEKLGYLAAGTCLEL